MEQYAELEITLRRREAGGCPVELRFVAINSDSDERVPAKGAAFAEIDPNLELAPGEAAAYGKTLGAALFANEEIRAGFQKARGALGPLLVDSGVPAVIAMQGKVKMAMLAKFMPEFFEALSKGGGQVDRAMGIARESAADDECDDYWMPVLFMRLRTGRLWYVRSPESEQVSDDPGTGEELYPERRESACVPPIRPFGSSRTDAG